MPELLAADSPAKAFEGTFRYAGGGEQEAKRNRAIDEVVAPMNVFARGIARGKLIDGNPIVQQVAIGGADGKLALTMDERDYRAPMDGQPARVKGISGDDLDLRYAIGSELLATFAGEGRGKVITFSVAGDELKIEVRVYSEQLPTDLVYALTYRRI